MTTIAAATPAGRRGVLLRKRSASNRENKPNAAFPIANNSTQSSTSDEPNDLNLTERTGNTTSNANSSPPKTEPSKQAASKDFVDPETSLSRPNEDSHSMAHETTSMKSLAAKKEFELPNQQQPDDNFQESSLYPSSPLDDDTNPNVHSIPETTETTSPPPESSPPDRRTARIRAPKSKASLEKDAKNWFNMGTLFFANQNYTNSQSYFQRALRAREQIHQASNQNHPSVAIVHEKLGDVHQEMEDIEEAIIHYDTAMRILRNSCKETTMTKPPPSQPLAGSKMVRLSMDVQKSTAREYAECDVTMAERINAKLRELRSKEKTNDTAASDHPPLPSSSSSSDIKIPKDKQPKTVTFSSTSTQEPIEENYLQGLAHMSCGKYSDAKQCFEQSHKTHVANLGEHHVKVSLLKEKIGDATAMMGDTREALAYYMTALENLRLQKVPNGDDAVARILLRAGDLYLELGEHALSAKCYQEALSTPDVVDDRNSSCSSGGGGGGGSIAHILKKTIQAHEEMAKHAAQNLRMMDALLHCNLATVLMQFYFMKEEIDRENLNSVETVREKHHLGTLSLCGFQPEILDYDTVMQTFQRVLSLAGIDEHFCQTRNNVPKQNKTEIAVILHNLGVQHERSSRLDAAMEHYEKSLAIKREIYEEGNAKIAKTIGCMGYVHFVRGEDEDALRCFEEVKGMFDPRDGNDNNNNKNNVREYMTMLSNMAALYSKRNQMDEAALCLEEKIKLIKETVSHYNSEIIETYNQLGCLYLRNGQHDKAIECLEKTLLVNECLENDANEQAQLCQLLGRLYHKIGQHDEAMKFFQKALVLERETGSSSSNEETIASMLRNLGTSHMEKGTYDEAVKFYKASLQASKPLDKALVLNRMGVIHSRKSEQTKALECFRRALEIKSLKHTDEYDDISVLLLNNMGNVYFASGNDKRAMIYYNKALDLGTKIQYDRDKIVASLEDMGVLCMKHQFRHEARYRPEATNRVHEFSEPSHIVNGNDPEEDIAMILSNIGLVHLKQGDHEDSVDSYEQSLRRLEQISRNDDEKLVGILTNLGTANFQLKAYDNALESFQRALTIMEETTSSDERNDLITATLLNKIGNALVKKKKYKLAKQRYEEALALKTNVLGDRNHDEILLIRHNIGLVLCKEHRFDEATEVLREVYDSRKKKLGELHPEVVKLLLDMGSVSFARKDHANAKTLCEKALKLFEKAGLSPNHPYMRQAWYTLERLDVALF